MAASGPSRDASASRRRSRGLISPISWLLRRREAERRAGIVDVEATVPGRRTMTLAHCAERGWLASGHGDHNVRITAARTGRLVCVLEGHSTTPWNLAFHPMRPEFLISSTLARGLRPGAMGRLAAEVILWDIDRRCQLAIWTLDNHAIGGTFDPEGNFFLVSDSRRLALLDLRPFLRGDLIPSDSPVERRAVFMDSVPDWPRYLHLSRRRERLVATQERSRAREGRNVREVRLSSWHLRAAHLEGRLRELDGEDPAEMEAGGEDVRWVEDHRHLADGVHCFAMGSVAQAPDGTLIVARTVPNDLPHDDSVMEDDDEGGGGGGVGVAESSTEWRRRVDAIARPLGFRDFIAPIGVPAEQEQRTELLCLHVDDDEPGRLLLRLALPLGRALGEITTMALSPNQQLLCVAFQGPHVDSLEPAPLRTVQDTRSIREQESVLALMIHVPGHTLASRRALSQEACQEAAERPIPAQVIAALVSECRVGANSMVWGSSEADGVALALFRGWVAWWRPVDPSSR